MCINSDIEDASDNFGSGIMCCLFTAAAHASLSFLDLCSICTRRTRAVLSLKKKKKTTGKQ